MGLWSAITGSDRGSTTETRQTTSQTQTQKGTVSGTGTTTTLDPATIGLLQGVIKQLVPGGTSPFAAQAGDLVKQLTTLSNPDAVNARVASAQGVAKQNFAAGEGAQIGQLQQQIGSTGNSFAQLIAQRGNIDLSTQLGNIDATIRTQAEQQQAQELSAGIAGLGQAQDLTSAPLLNFLNAIKVLTGARTEQDTKQVQDLLATMQGTTFTKGHTSEETSQGVIPSFTSLFGGDGG